MKLIKLNAIDSTNRFLKDLANDQTVENFTVVTATHQTHGKGQMGSKWLSESGKNITISILIKELLTKINHIYILNVAVALGIIDALQCNHVPGLSIKWPNDIMSDTKKIGGILIENILKANNNIISIIGIGINVNQTHFETLHKASSLALIMNKTIDKDLLQNQIIDKVKEYTSRITESNNQELWNLYHTLLFKKNTPTVFQDLHHNTFMGIIKGVLPQGKLEVILENDSTQVFDVKEIQMLY